MKPIVLSSRSLAWSALAVLAALPASAGLRQWEPSDYVQDSLVLHYDGIRNAGLGVAHDNAATTWVDLSGNGRDATLTAGSGSVWKEDGFHFAKTAWFQTAASFSLGTSYTMELLTAFTSSDMSGNGMFVGPSGGIKDGAVWWKQGDANIFHRGDDTFGTAWNQCPGIRPSPTTYLTALRDGSRAAITAAAALPTTENTKGPANSITDWFTGSKNNSAANSVWFVGAKNASGEEPLAGDIKSVRLYTTLLTDAQLAWNRAVDEARFFGASAVTAAPVASAVPNAFIATAVTGAEGAETSGCYVVDEGGYTFRATPFASVSGAAYVCKGYTLAAWDATLGAYGAAVSHDGEFSCFVAQGDKVKITWQWEAAAGGSLGSDASGYVADNLLYHFDGIRNAGIDRPHDASALSWANLADRSSDVTLYHKTTSDCAQGFGDGAFAGEWAEDGFIFRGTNFFYKGGAWTMPADATLQLVADIKPWAQESNIPFVFGETDSSKRSGGLIVNKGAGRLDFYCDGQLGCNYNSRPRITITPFTYATAIIAGNKAAIFPGTEIPDNSNTDASAGGWFIQTDDGNVKGAFSNDRLTIGGGVNWSGTYMVGTVKAIRLYSGVLTDAQLAQNRALDEARFFGNGAPASNAVVVASSIAGLEGREPSGIYFPDGWTFSSGTGTQTARGIEWHCAGYQLQTWDAASSTWGAATTSTATSYTSPTGSGYATRRLVWLWEPVSGIRTAADYALSDYATGGVQLHLDGIEHGYDATIWSDLSGHGRDATLRAASGATGNAWVTDGYQFNANADFATSKSFALGRSATVQILADAPTVSQTKSLGTFVSPVNAQPKSGTLLYKKANDYILYQADDLNWVGDGDAWKSRTTIETPAAPVTYLTALREGSRTAVFTGTTYPTNATNDRNGQALRGWAYGPVDLVAAASPWTVGGYRNASGTSQTDYWLTGTIKSVRLYDRMLTEDELTWNRNVDSARYFGALATTNVVVVANEWSGLAADTAYEVFGTYTFAASPSSWDGSAANLVKVQTLQPNGSWGETTQVEGDRYDYAPAAGTVRIEFRKANPFVLIVR